MLIGDCFFMANDCRNILFASHTDRQRVAALSESFLKDEFFNSVIQQKSPDVDRDWCLKHWGCRSEARHRGSTFHSGNLIVLSFDTSWTPPIGVYKAMVTAGWDLIAYYSEPGCEFCGRFSNDNDAYFEFTDGTSADLRRHLPADIDNIFEISWRMFAEEFDDAIASPDEFERLLDAFTQARLSPEVWTPSGRFPFP